ncbi:MAG TPA: hypothetical protein PKK30_06300 [Nitrospira sp.]|nr:hypothetical protein [Nitrospira sp.]
MTRGLARAVIMALLIGYLLLALPLPTVLLDHELGLLMGDAAHTVLDDHAWLDHAAGSGLSESGHVLDAGNLLVSLAFQAPSNPSLVLYLESCLSRGPPLV